MKEKTLSEQLKDKLSSMSSEEIKKDWEETKEKHSGGPKIIDFIRMQEIGRFSIAFVNTLHDLCPHRIEGTCTYNNCKSSCNKYNCEYIKMYGDHFNKLISENLDV
ncbi:MAG: hypothetical protein RSE41_00190 [Clostridia bacterium]